MPLQPPPPPSITPRQMNLLRAVASMAWSDGELATEEVDLMLDRFSLLFGTAGTQQQQSLKEELRDYMMQNIPLEELIPLLPSPEERELVLRLGYEVIASSARTPDEPAINAEEAEAYKRLVGLLNLPEDAVERIEAECQQAAYSHEGLVGQLADKLQQFIQG
ncbi:tellurite resistance TerB family protein [Kamptonema formosum]|uniref:tellurite resistance TerB family protein n=1 Tax=Kamptonema formosum TaxID=331992 RepID=UPI00034C9AD6|nr:TerB family tellurite resistance protein [Oscillatoria sp. PCC 10802]